MCGHGRARIPPTVIDAFKDAADEAKLTVLKDSVAKFNKQYEGVLTTTTQAASHQNPEQTPGGVEDLARTSCTPAFTDGDRPIDIDQTLLPSDVLASDQFETQVEFLARKELHTKVPVFQLPRN